MISRREAVGTLSLVAVTGCMRNGVGVVRDTADQTEPDTDGDGVPNRVDDFPENDRYTYLVNADSETTQLKRGAFKLYKFSVNATSDLRYRVRTQGGSRIDVFVTDEANFDQYEERSTWNYYDEGSELDTAAARATFTIGADRTYYLIIDNSPEGDATPSPGDGGATVTVSIDVEIRRRA